MSKKVIFKINKDLDFQNHLIGARIALRDIAKMSSGTSDYFRSLRDCNDEEKLKIFNERTAKFYDDEMTDVRALLIKQAQEMWDLVEDKYFSKMEYILQKNFSFEGVSAVLSTTPMIYSYNFKENNLWFACPHDSAIKAVHTAMHEIMHLFFHKYFWGEYKNKFELSDDQIYKVKEAVTVILNLEFNDIRLISDRGHFGHEDLREKIKNDWLKYKDFEKVLNEACIYIKVN